MSPNEILRLAKLCGYSVEVLRGSNKPMFIIKPNISVGLSPEEFAKFITEKN